jgi:hypothetical protein
MWYFFVQAGNKPNSVLGSIYLSRKLLCAIKRTTFHPSIILGASLENMNASNGLFTLSLPKGLFLLPGKNLAVSPPGFPPGIILADFHPLAVLDVSARISGLAADGYYPLPLLADNRQLKVQTFLPSISSG